MVLLTIITLILLAEASFLTYRALRPSDSRESGRAPLFIDTSVLMDGRIVTAAQTGFLPTPIAIPNSVINELQLLADQADAEKRSRARRGLDAIKELQDIDWLEVKIIKDGPTGNGGVDTRLIELAKKHHGTICTIDFNLNKVASVQGIRVLNINELAGSIRMAFLPGETISMPLTQKGQNSTQAVGYLADGTMVVVEKAAGQIGQTVEIEFIRSLQTAAGRMMFARLSTKSKPAQTRGTSEGSSRMIAEKQIRGGAESGGRMIANKTQPKAEQTRGEAEGRSRMFENKPAKQQPAQTRGASKGRNLKTEKNSDKPTLTDDSVKASRSTEVKPVDEAKSDSQRSKPAKAQANRRRNSRRTKEDSLIELVNSQD